ncbi:hypothetical protein JOC75_003598 [Metabacillus crassostreae]|uniref:DNA-primase RepB domain-containing protein n=1 Tax=Metabacillus crassostreae TaxID=929098 RepID=UPI00195CCD8F|nr:DNA-primase RepB domain-containing protein [Metabacillus crassostreae]MBM7605575.1 hypothetical protein [Metabacillus crassostreae]
METIQELYNIGESLLSFLSNIHGENAVEIRYIPENIKNAMSISIIMDSNSLYTTNNKGEIVKVCEATTENFIRHIEEYYRFAGHTAVCFTPNSPNFKGMDSCTTTNKHVIEGGNINCQFVDIDAPKDLRHDYRLVKEWKKKLKERILAFSLRPSYVIETKNGYHVYWLLENGQHHLFRHIQMQLVKHFDGDSKCVNESRLLRLPHFYHRKDPSDPYGVRFKIKEPNNRYIQEDLKDSLPELDVETIQKVFRNSIEVDYEISNAKRSDILPLLSGKLDQYITKENEKTISMQCCMPSHEDRRPSAWFDKEYMWYHCAGCGKHYSLTMLATEFNWKDIIDAWEKYDIDFEIEIERIKDNAIKVSDLSELVLNSDDTDNVNLIVDKVVNTLHSYGQNVSTKHGKYIKDTLQILYKGTKEKPYLIPLDMGAGKSLIIKSYLEEMLKANESFGAVVAVGRIEDVKDLASYLNSSVGKEVAFPMYGFRQEECIINTKRGTDFNKCIAKHGKTCPFKQDCRYWTQSEEQQSYPVIIMTLERLYLQSSNLDQFNYFFYGKNRVECKRDCLIIDEKPKMISVDSIDLQIFYRYTEEILNKLKNFNFDESQQEYEEFKKCVDLVESLYEVNEWKGREIFYPTDKSFKFSKIFWKVFYRLYDYTQNIYQMPNILESIIVNGGSKEVLNEERITLTTSTYKEYKCFLDYKTFIFDGTADIELEYEHSKFNIINFEPLRSYKGLTFFQCDLVKGSKTGMKDVDMLKAFCEDVIRILKDNPTEMVFLPVFKESKSYIAEYLKEYLESERVVIAHYGSTRGSNLYKDCSIVILGGILHKTESYYIGKAMALQKCRNIEIEDISCSNYSSVRRFDDSSIEVVKMLDMLVDYSQEIKRSKQRDNSKDVEGQVYVFHKDKILLDMINLKFPKSKVEKWIPQNMLEHNVNSKTNKKNVQAFLIYIKENSNRDEIKYTEFRKALGMTSQAFSNLVRKNVEVKAILNVQGYEIRVDEKNKREKIFVKFR